MRVANLLDFCHQSGYHDLPHKPVITLTNTSSRTGETNGHAVVLDKYDRDKDCLVLTCIDSASETGQTFIVCPILIRYGQQELAIRGEVDQWCLGSDKCYVFYFNWPFTTWCTSVRQSLCIKKMIFQKLITFILKISITLLQGLEFWSAWGVLKTTDSLSETFWANFPINGVSSLKSATVFNSTNFCQLDCK